MPRTYELQFAGQQLVLCADRSVWWPAGHILFIADLHAGKAEHMQRSGLRVPAGSLQADLKRLQAAINELNPERVIVLGDLFHSDINDEWDILVDWCSRQQCSIELIRGNHDRFINDDIFTAGGVIVHQENFQLEPFTLRHHPNAEISNNEFVLCGHLHPVRVVRGPAHDRLRLPVFAVSTQQIILPAFGSFTGGYVMRRHETDFCVAAAPDFQSVIVLN